MSADVAVEHIGEGSRQIGRLTLDAPQDPQFSDHGHGRPVGCATVGLAGR